MENIGKNWRKKYKKILEERIGLVKIFELGFSTVLHILGSQRPRKTCFHKMNIYQSVYLSVCDTNLPCTSTMLPCKL